MFMFIESPLFLIVFVRLFWSEMCLGCLFYFKIEGFHLSEGAW